MGQEIVYCDGCGSQIRSSDFENGQAFKLDSQNFCLKCGPDMLRSLPKAQVKDILQDITSSSRGIPVLPSPAAVLKPATTKRLRAARRPGRPTVAAAAAATPLVAAG